MKCIRCGKNVRTSAEERNFFRGMGYYTPMYWVKDQGLNETICKSEGLDPNDSEHFLCFDCYYDLMEKQRDEYLKNKDFGPIKIKGTFKESKVSKKLNEVRVREDGTRVYELMDYFINDLQDRGFRKITPVRGSGEIAGPKTFFVVDISGQFKNIEVSINGQYEDDIIAMFDNFSGGVSGSSMYQLCTADPNSADPSNPELIWWAGKTKEDFINDIADLWSVVRSQSPRVQESKNLKESTQEERDQRARDLIESPYNNLQEEDFEWLREKDETLDYWDDQTFEMEIMERSLYDGPIYENLDESKEVSFEFSNNADADEFIDDVKARYHYPALRSKHDVDRGGTTPSGGKVYFKGAIARLR